MDVGSAAIRFTTFASLSEEDRTGLSSMLGEKRLFAKKDFLQEEDVGPPSLYVIWHGWTASSISVASGDRQILKVHLPGDLVGSSSLPLNVAANTITALTDVVASVVSLKELGNLFVNSPRLAALLYVIAQEERVALMDRLTTTGRVEAHGRLASFLLQLRERMRRDNPFIDKVLITPLKQRHFADVLGITEQHMSRIVNDYRLQGLANWNPSRIELTNIPALRKLSELPIRTLAANLHWLPTSQ